tara:strand:- start:324 stop:719 length:396 start_codon:yes stop_codon:yes gene_type:complete
MKKKIIFVVSLLFGLMFINAGLNKFFNYMPVPDDLPEKMMKMMTAFSEISWLLPLVGVAEVLGGILFILPKTRALGAIVIFPVMIGILLTNIIYAPTGLPIAMTLLAINLWVLYENRVNYLPLINGLNSNS